MTSRISCDNTQTEKWKKISCKLNHCRHNTLSLGNLTDENAGLYKCIMYPYKPNEDTTLNIMLVKVYQLHVKSKYFILHLLANNISLGLDK